MTGWVVSASKTNMAEGISRILIILPNWIGDVVMSLPALQQLKKERPDVELHLTCRPFLRSLLEASSVADFVHDLPSDNVAFFKACKGLGALSFDQIIVFPNSFRSGLAAKLIGAKKRTGVAGHQRGFFLTDVRTPDQNPDQVHQAWEYISLCDVSCENNQLPIPDLEIPEAAFEGAKEMLPQDKPYFVGIIPGAARGASKEWPEEYFRELARLINRYGGAGIALFGGPSDVEKCERLRKSLGENAINFAGKTSLTEWMALMSLCKGIVANDSGGMHIASALGLPVIGLYGITDPAKTGPLGARTRVLKKSNRASRDIPRHSEEAQTALRAIKPEEVWAELNPLMETFMEVPVDA